MRLLVLLLAGFHLLAAPAWGATEAVPQRSDPRVQYYVYDPTEVFELRGAVGFVSTIVFRADETVQGVSAGDTLGWEITPSGDRRVLFVKPVDQHAIPSNLTVITDKRLYAFGVTLDPLARYSGGTPPTFLVRFRYPADEAREMAAMSAAHTEAAAFEREQMSRLLPGSAGGQGIGAAAPEDWNFDYTYRGHDDLRPTRAFDDGTRTYFQFPEFVRQPAIFVVDETGAESLVNFDVRGRYYVIHALARQFTVRDGPLQSCIYNKDYPADVHGPLAPALEERATFEAQIPEGT